MSREIEYTFFGNIYCNLSYSICDADPDVGIFQAYPEDICLESWYIDSEEKFTHEVGDKIDGKFVLEAAVGAIKLPSAAMSKELWEAIENGPEWGRMTETLMEIAAEDAAGDPDYERDYDD